MATAISAASLEAISGAFIALSTVVVALRFYARLRTKMPLQSDDWTMLASLVCLLVYCACAIFLVQDQVIGWDTMPESKDVGRPWYIHTSVQFVSNVASSLTLGLTKLSALLLYRRIFCYGEALNRSLHWIIVVSAVIVVCWTITFSVLAGFECKGSSLMADENVQNRLRNCTLSGINLYGSFVSDVILDTWVICLPIPSLVQLRLSLKKKILTTGVFCVALVGLAASFVRLALFLQIQNYRGGVHLGSEVPNDTIYFYNTLEQGMMLISINIPLLSPILTKYTPELMVKWARSVTSLASGSSSRRSQADVTSSRDEPDSPSRGSEDAKGDKDLV